MTITFNYKNICRPDPYESDTVPAIPVTLSGKSRALDVIGLVDSGADYCAIPLSIANDIGLDLSSSPEIIGGFGGNIRAVRTKMALRLHKNRERYVFTVGVYVIMGDLEDDFPLIIGRHDFFDKFKITFIEKQRKIKLKRDLS